MATAAKPERQAPSAFDGNMELLVSESLPGQIRAMQTEINELERSIAARRAVLRRLLDTALLFNVPLCPLPASVRESGNAAGPGGADGVIRGAAA